VHSPLLWWLRRDAAPLASTELAAALHMERGVLPISPYISLYLPISPSAELAAALHMERGALGATYTLTLTLTLTRRAGRHLLEG